MNEELSKLLTDLFVGAIFDDEEVQGISFTRYDDGAAMLNICCATNPPIMDSVRWHHILVPSAGIQFVQDRLTSVEGSVVQSEQSTKALTRQEINEEKALF